MKPIRDLVSDPVRSTLTALAVAAGVFGISFILDAYAILGREIGAAYEKSSPRSASIWLDRVDKRAEDIARTFPGISEAQASRGPIRARVRVSSGSYSSPGPYSSPGSYSSPGPYTGRWIVLQLFEVEDFQDLRVDRFFPRSGAWPPAEDGILFEKSSLAFIGASVGDKVTVRAMSAPAAVEAAAAGTVFDPGQDPSWVNEIAYGYATPAGIARLGAKPPEPGLRVVAAGNRSRVMASMKGLAAALSAQGYTVKRIEVPATGKYPQADKANSLLAILFAFGLLCLLLSCALTALLVSSMTKSQMRQIGAMKAVGAGGGQVAALYLSSVLALALAAVAVGVPLGALAGRAFSLWALALLNFESSGAAVPAWAILAECALGVAAPLLSAAFPLAASARITVRQALADESRRGSPGEGRLAAALARSRILPRPLSIALRNSLRGRGRLVLQLLMLASGGASFIASLDAAASWNRAIDAELAGLRYDAEVRFGQAYPAERIESVLRATPGIAQAQARAYAMASAFPRYSDGSYGGPYPVFGIQAGSKLVRPRVVEGSWYRDDAPDEIVVDTDFVDDARKRGAPVAVGDALSLNLAGVDRPFRVAGIVDKQGTQSAAYLPYRSLAAALGQEGLAASAVIVAEGSGPEARELAVRAAEASLAEAGMTVFLIQGLDTTRAIMANHVVLMLSLLMLMSVLIAAVGAMALASTMGTAVAQRRREYGVMRAIGARGRSIIASVLVEGALIGALSWALAALLALPLTQAIAVGTGSFIFPRVMGAAHQGSSFAAWFLIAAATGALAAWYPAAKAAGITVRDALSYE